MSMINYASREINCKIVYYGSRPRRQDDESRARLRQGAARHARQAHLARDGDRAHAVLRFPAGGPRARSAASRRGSTSTPCPARCTTTRAGSSSSRAWTASCSSPTRRWSGWRRTRRPCRTCTTTWPSTGTTSRRCRSSIQYNKRDLPNAAPVRELQAALNPGWEVTEPAQAARHPGSVPRRARTWSSSCPTGEWVERAPYFEAVAVTGDGVFETLTAVSKLVLKSLA